MLVSAAKMDFGRGQHGRREQGRETEGGAHDWFPPGRPGRYRPRLTRLAEPDVRTTQYRCYFGPGASTRRECGFAWCLTWNPEKESICPVLVPRREPGRQEGTRNPHVAAVRGCPRNCKRRARVRIGHWETGKAGRRQRPASQETCQRSHPTGGRKDHTERLFAAVTSCRCGCRAKVIFLTTSQVA